MYRMRYEIIEHKLNIDNYKVENTIDSGFLYGDTIEEIKENAIDFTIKNKYTEQLDQLKQFRNRNSSINEYSLNAFKKASEEFNYGRLAEYWNEISFESIELIPKTFGFNLEKELKNSKKYQTTISSGIKYIEKSFKEKKQKELEHAKKQYERKLKELEND